MDKETWMDYKHKVFFSDHRNENAKEFSKDST